MKNDKIRRLSKLYSFNFGGVIHEKKDLVTFRI